MKSLAEALGTEIPPQVEDEPNIVDFTDPKEFSQAVLASREFRQYIRNGLILGELPAAIVCRMMDYAWGQPVKRVEHTGKDGEPIVTEVRRVVIHVTPRPDHELEQEERSPAIH